MNHAALLMVFCSSRPALVTTLLIHKARILDHGPGEWTGADGLFLSPQVFGANGFRGVSRRPQHNLICGSRGRRRAMGFGGNLIPR